MRRGARKRVVDGHISESQHKCLRLRHEGWFGFGQKQIPVQVHVFVGESGLVDSIVSENKFALCQQTQTSQKK